MLVISSQFDYKRYISKDLAFLISMYYSCIKERTDQKDSVNPFRCRSFRLWNLRCEKESDLPGVTWPQLMSSDSCPCPARLSTWLCWGKINHSPFVLFALALLLSTGMKRHTITVLLTLFCFADSLSKYCLNAAPLAVGSRNNIYSVKKAKAVTWLISVFRSAKWEHTKLLCSSCLFSSPLGIMMKFKALHTLKGVEI